MKFDTRLANKNRLALVAGRLGMSRLGANMSHRPSVPGATLTIPWSACMDLRISHIRGQLYELFTEPPWPLDGL